MSYGSGQPWQQPCKKFDLYYTLSLRLSLSLSTAGKWKGSVILAWRLLEESSNISGVGLTPKTTQMFFLGGLQGELGKRTRSEVGPSLGTGCTGHGAVDRLPRGRAPRVWTDDQWPAGALALCGACAE